MPAGTAEMNAFRQSFCPGGNRFWRLPGEKTPETIIKPEEYRLFRNGFMEVTGWK